MSAWFVYITAKDKQQAYEIGRALVEERLVACVNIVDVMTSMYWWQDKVQEDNEAVCIAKTRQTLIEPLIERVKQLHSYECPCVIAWPIQAANEAYLKWIRDETH